MSLIGSFALLLALALSAYSFLAGVRVKSPGAGLGTAGRDCEPRRNRDFRGCFLAAVVLVISAFRMTSQSPTFSTTAIAICPSPYKFAALWSGQEGSLLFWAWLLSAYGLVLRMRYKVDPRLFAYASAIIAAVQVFFLLLMNFAAHPLPS